MLFSANLRKQKNGEEVPACADPQPAGNQRRSSSATKRNRSGEAAHFEMGNDEPQITPGWFRINTLNLKKSIKTDKHSNGLELH